MGLITTNELMPKIQAPEARNLSENMQNIFICTEMSSLTSSQCPCSFIMPCNICYSL